METTNDKRNNAQRPATQVAPGAPDAPVRIEGTHDPQPGTGAAGTTKETHDEAIEEAVEGIHG